MSRRCSTLYFIKMRGTKGPPPEQLATSRSAPPDGQSRANSADQSTISPCAVPDDSGRTSIVEKSTVPHSDRSKERSTASFLTLPPELRHAIYDLSLPIRHLSTAKFIDDEHHPEPQTFPALFLVNRQISSEATTSFYRKAILSLPVPALSPDLHSWATGTLPPSSQSPSLQRDRSFAFLPQHLKDQIRHAQLFNNEAGPFPTPVAYNALLSWLSRNTGILEIEISKALMFRACKRRSIREAEAEALLSLSPTSLATRTLKIYSRNSREFWEGRAMGAGRGTIVAEQAPSLRMFICLASSKTTTLICDPRGTPRMNRQNSSEVERVHGSMVGDILDGLRTRNPELSDEVVQRTEEDGRWLFQVVFVV